jgi:hypothetical protein
LALPKDTGQISTLKVKRIFKNPQDVMQRRVPVPALNCVGDPMLQQRFHQFYSENEVVVPGVAEALSASAWLWDIRWSQTWKGKCDRNMQKELEVTWFSAFPRNQSISFMDRG